MSRCFMSARSVAFNSTRRGLKTAAFPLDFQEIGWNRPVKRLESMFFQWRVTL